MIELRGLPESINDLEESFISGFSGDRINFTYFCIF